MDIATLQLISILGITGGLFYYLTINPFTPYSDKILPPNSKKLFQFYSKIIFVFGFCVYLFLVFMLPYNLNNHYFHLQIMSTILTFMIIIIINTNKNSNQLLNGIPFIILSFIGGSLTCVLMLHIFNR